MRRALKKWLILPVEIKVRELDAKLWLAAAGLQRGYGVVLGSIRQVERYEDRLPSGIYFAKDISPARQEQLRRLKGRHRAIVCQDEETTIANGSYEVFFDQRVSTDSLDLTRFFFCWGPSDSEVLKGLYPSDRDKIVSTGSLRVDLWRPELRDYYAASVRSIRAAHGDYILIASNFLANDISPEEQVIDIGKKLGTLRDDRAVDRLARELAFGRDLFEHFKEAPRILAEAFPETAVIIRPHPIENPAAWQEAVRGLPNASVIFEGTITPWLLGARAVLHNSCTSAVESALLDRPVISYMPITSSEFDFQVANAVGQPARNAAELVEAAGKALEDPESFLTDQRARSHAVLAKHLAALDGPLAAERMLASLEALSWDGREESGPTMNGRLCTLVDTFHHKRMGLKRRLRGDSIKRRWHKFPGLGAQELREKLERLAGLQGFDPAFRIERLSKDLFAVWPS